MKLSPRGQICEMRIKKNMTMEELGERLGMTKQGVKNLERREVVGSTSIATLVRVAQALGCKFEYRIVEHPKK